VLGIEQRAGGDVVRHHRLARLVRGVHRLAQRGKGEMRAGDAAGAVRAPFVQHVEAEPGRVGFAIVESRRAQLAPQLFQRDREDRARARLVADPVAPVEQERLAALAFE